MKLLFLVATAVSSLSLAQAAALAPPVMAIEEYEKRQVLGLEDRSAAPQIEARTWAGKAPAKPKVEARTWAGKAPAKPKIEARTWAGKAPAKLKVEGRTWAGKAPAKPKVEARTWAGKAPAKSKTGVKARTWAGKAPAKPMLRDLFQIWRHGCSEKCPSTGTPDS